LSEDHTNTFTLTHMRVHALSRTRAHVAVLPMTGCTRMGGRCRILPSIWASSRRSLYIFVMEASISDEYDVIPSCNINSICSKEIKCQYTQTAARHTHGGGGCIYSLLAHYIGRPCPWATPLVRQRQQITRKSGVAPTRPSV